MKIYFATWLEEVNQGICLTNKKAWNRLLSYFFLKKRKEANKDLKEYMGAQ